MTEPTEPPRLRFLKRLVALVAVSLFAFLAFLGTRTLLVVPENQDHLRRICRSQNEQNAKQVALWEKLFNLPPSKFETPEQRAENEARIPGIRDFVNETFAQEKCP